MYTVGRCVYIYMCVCVLCTTNASRDGMCGPAVYNISTLMYYIGNEEWCNKEATRPKIAERGRARRYVLRSRTRMSGIARHRMALHRGSSAATSERRHMQFCAELRKKNWRVRKGWRRAVFRARPFFTGSASTFALFTLYITFRHPRERMGARGARALSRESEWVSERWPSSARLYLSAARRKCALLVLACEIYLPLCGDRV